MNIKKYLTFLRRFSEFQRHISAFTIKKSVDSDFVCLCKLLNSFQFISIFFVALNDRTQRWPDQKVVTLIKPFAINICPTESSSFEWEKKTEMSRNDKSSSSRKSYAANEDNDRKLYASFVREVASMPYRKVEERHREELKERQLYEKFKDDVQKIDWEALKRDKKP